MSRTDPNPATETREIIVTGSLWSSAFWVAAIERAIKTAAQAAIAGTGTAAAFNDVSWAQIGMIVALAAVLSILTSIATAAATDGSPSAANEALTTGARQGP
jgi:hypothetical protein